MQFHNEDADQTEKGEWQSLCDMAGNSLSQCVLWLTTQPAFATWILLYILCQLGRHDNAQMQVYLKQVWRRVCITPLLQLWVCIDDHATPHSRHSKQLNVIARVTVD